MGNRKTDTEARLLEAGQQEFLKYGYEQASMRRIAANAKVTTGAIYGYYPSKEAVFEALVGTAANGLLQTYKRLHEEFERMPAQSQAGKLDEITEVDLVDLVQYIYDHYDAFRLLFCCGSRGYAERYINQLAEIEETSARNFLNTMKVLGYPVQEIEETVIHILIRSFFRQLQEFIVQEVPREKACAYVLTLGRFRQAGWMRLAGII